MQSNRKSTKMNSLNGLPLLSALLLFAGTVNCVYRIQLSSIPGSKVGREDVSSLNVGHIGLGTPPQNMSIIMDTGSADFWVTSSNCDETCGKLHLFSGSKSKTYQCGEEDCPEDFDVEDCVPESEEDEDLCFTLEYGTGSIYMKKSRDNLEIGGLCAKNVSFGEALNVSDTFTTNELDGIMGFGFSPLSRSGMKPVYEVLDDQGLMKEPYFTFCQNSDTGSKKIHELYLGGTNPSYYKGLKARANITKPEYWTFTLDQIKLGNGKTTCTNGCDAAADTGTSDIRGPREFAEELNNMIGAYRKNESDIDYTIDCDTTNTPSVSFVIGGHPFVLTPDDYVYKEKDGSCRTVFGISRSDATTFWILGQWFLKGLCTEFHFKEKYLVFAPIKEELMN
ncbi:cathepsin D-like [Periplaneta americana]|uniref:cathepsin D-like n=1 Tax=Periplaneta americana TaxID=6978 RepID=UPI0037E6F9D4